MRASVLKFPEANEHQEKQVAEEIGNHDDFEATFAKLIENKEFDILERATSQFLIKSAEISKCFDHERIIFEITSFFFSHKKNELFINFFSKAKKAVEINKLNLEVKIFIQLYFYFCDFEQQLNFKSFYNYQEKKSRFFYLKFLKNKSESKYPFQLEKIIKQLDDLFLNLINNSKFNYNHFFVSLNRKKFNQIDFLNLRNIKKTSQGSDHILFLTDDQKLIGFGDNSKNQLIPFIKTEFFDKAVCLSFFNKKVKENINIIDIFCYDNISGCFFDNMKIFLWGALSPFLIEIEGVDHFYKVCILKDSIILLREDLVNSKLILISNLSKKINKISNKNFQLKFDFKALLSEKIVQNLESEKIGQRLKSVKKGDNHLIIITEGDELHGFGDNTKNQLDHSKTTFYNKLIILSNFTGEKIKQIFAHGNFSLVQDEFNNYSIFGQFNSKSSKIKRNSKISRNHYF